MAEIIQKKFEDLREGDRVLVELTFDSFLEQDLILKMQKGGNYAEYIRVEPSLYRGVLPPKRKPLKVGMKFNFGGSVFSQIYAISGDTVFYFCSANPYITGTRTVEDLSQNPNIKWLDW